ncbi:MAG: phosphoribosylformylglycinamidine synthase subunit PurL [Actinobacteria bacterium]|nr:phosphoribosylformylglycinamidine synthase subunit PurL [Actinomycetota bacterium]
MALDTVAKATSTPEIIQPWRELGLKEDEYQRIREILGRRPTSSELAMYSVMWSEHCSYKSSKVHLRQFGEKAPQSDALLVGIGENAGVVDVGQGYAVTFKVESHNHPSFIEPYQGAATGVGGIVRDILTMGARPIAILDPLRFGCADAPDTKRVLPGVIAGIGGYGNCIGVPTIGGEVIFDDSYSGNPLVNALCVGVMKHEDIKLAKASGAGNLVLLFGAKTGGDGIGGVSVLASETFDDKKPTKRPAVQVGDPFTEKVLIECSLEIFKEDLVVGIQDLGGAGLSCATSELASAGTGGMRVELDRVPLRDANLSPEEILMSESQERMCAVVPPEKVERFMEICKKWDVVATVIGEVTSGKHLEITWHGELIVDVPPRTVAHDGPVYNRPFTRPAWQGELVGNGAENLPRPQSESAIADAILTLISSPNIADKSWITSQYDRYVQGNTIAAGPSDAAVIRIDENTFLGVAVATDCNGRFCKLDPYEGTQLALAESFRNVAVTGAKPLAITNCLNFGSPEDAGVMWQFAESVRALADGALEMGLPVTGGNVSFYNQTGAVAILPTPVIGVLGVIDDVRKAIPYKFSGVKELILLGETLEEFSGGEWAHLQGHLGGLPPRVDLKREMVLAQFMYAQRDFISAAHDLSDGGLAVALIEMLLHSQTGAKISIHGDPFTHLFSESTGRILLAVNPEDSNYLVGKATDAGITTTRLGQSGGENLEISGVLSMSMLHIREANQRTIPALFTA